MKTFLALAKKRYSVRSYSERAVEEEKLDYLLECGRVAPSAANFQPWHIYVVRDPGMRASLASTYKRDWFRQAPVILVFCGDHQAGWKRGDGKDHTDIDVSILVDHITLAAAEQGLGTCWICNFDAVNCSHILGLPGHLEPVAFLTLGYPSSDPENPDKHLQRKQLHEIVTYI